MYGNCMDVIKRYRYGIILFADLDENIESDVDLSEATMNAFDIILFEKKLHSSSFYVR